MKNIFLYISPKKEFGENNEILAKMQIENILELGWKPEDVMLLTNFPYEFMGIKSIIVKDEYFFADDPASTKSNTIAGIFENEKLFNRDDLYWVHDLDHFQQVPFDEEEIKDEIGDCDFALCDYGRRIKYNLGSVFFKKTSGDIWRRIRDVMKDCRNWSKKCEEERALMIMVTNNRNWAWRSSVGAENSFMPYDYDEKMNVEDLKKRIHKMHITYNFYGNQIRSFWKMCEGKPKTAHLNPFFERVTRTNPTGCKLQTFLGENKLGHSLINERLTNLFKKYGLS